MKTKQSILAMVLVLIAVNSFAQQEPPSDQIEAAGEEMFNEGVTEEEKAAFKKARKEATQSGGKLKAEDAGKNFKKAAAAEAAEILPEVKKKD